MLWVDGKKINLVLNAVKVLFIYYYYYYYFVSLFIYILDLCAGSHHMDSQLGC